MVVALESGIHKNNRFGPSADEKSVSIQAKFPIFQLIFF
jgi:hypothetical protein